VLKAKMCMYSLKYQFFVIEFCYYKTVDGLINFFLLLGLNSSISMNTFVFKSYDMKSLVFTYSRSQAYEVRYPSGQNRQKTV